MQQDCCRYISPAAHSLDGVQAKRISVHFACEDAKRIMSSWCRLQSSSAHLGNDDGSGSMVALLEEILGSPFPLELLTAKVQKEGVVQRLPPDYRSVDSLGKILVRMVSMVPPYAVPRFTCMCWPICVALLLPCSPQYPEKRLVVYDLARLRTCCVW